MQGWPDQPANASARAARAAGRCPGASRANRLLVLMAGPGAGEGEPVGSGECRGGWAGACGRAGGRGARASTALLWYWRSGRRLETVVRAGTSWPRYGGCSGYLGQAGVLAGAFSRATAGPGQVRCGPAGAAGGWGWFTGGGKTAGRRVLRRGVVWMIWCRETGRVPDEEARMGARASVGKCCSPLVLGRGRDG